MGFLANTLGLLARPVNTLTRLDKRDPPLRFETAVGHLVLVTFLGSCGLSAVSIAATLTLLPGTGTPEAAFVQGFALFLSFNFFGQLVFFGIVGAFLGGLWYHAWLTLFGVRDFRKTLTVYFYARTPAVLQFMFAVPESGGQVLYWLANLWSLFLFAHGIRVFHGLPLRSAATVAAIAFIVNFLAVAVTIGGYRPAPILFPQLSPNAIIPLPAPPVSALVPAG